MRAMEKKGGLAGAWMVGGWVVGWLGVWVCGWVGGWGAEAGGVGRTAARGHGPTGARGWSAWEAWGGWGGLQRCLRLSLDMEVEGTFVVRRVSGRLVASTDEHRCTGLLANLLLCCLFGQ